MRAGSRSAAAARSSRRTSLKPASSISASGDTMEQRAHTELLGFEGEIALIIGAPARRIAPEQAWSHVSGVTAANDFGVYDLRWADRGSNLRAKGGDRFARTRRPRRRRARPGRPARPDLGQREAGATGDERGTRLPLRPPDCRPLAADDPRTGRRDPDRYPGRSVGRRARRRRRGRGRCAGHAGGTQHRQAGHPGGRRYGAAGWVRRAAEDR